MLESSDLEQLAVNAGAAAALLKAMSHPGRLMILCQLVQGECCVSQLNESIPLSQSALSQHLANLRRAGLVSTRRDAQSIYYRLEGDGPQRIIAVLQDLYCPPIEPASAVAKTQ